jgi:hypothetical protein
VRVFSCGNWIDFFAQTFHIICERNGTHLCRIHNKKLKKTLFIAITIGMLAACATKTPPPKYATYSANAEMEYAPYVIPGQSTITGQAFLTQNGGGVVKAAGRVVTLDPVTEVSKNWWYQAGRVWNNRHSTPPSPNFLKARRVTTADADGRFKFANVPAGAYYLRTELTWQVPYHGIQGGLLFKVVEVKDGETVSSILNSAN